jgi:transposase
MHPKSGRRRRHSDELKAKVLAACDEPGASISGVALAHGLNANLVRKWRSGRGFKHAGTAIRTATLNKSPALPVGTTPEFVAIEMPVRPKAAARAAAEPMAAASIGEALIQIELRRGPLHLNVRWPTAAADDCRAWLRELSSGLLK